MFENLTYIPLLVDTYSSELSAIEAAAERGASTVERERAQLVRADGQPVYGPQEHQERERAIYEAAGAAFDEAAAKFVQQSERAVADLEKKLAMLDADPLDSLSAENQQRAAARRAFAQEDVTRLPPHELAARIGAAVAGADRVLAVLLNRYLPERNDVSGSVLREPVRALRTFLGDDERFEKRRDLEERIRAAKAVPVAISSARRRVDGSDAQMLAAMRQQLRSLV